MTSKTVEFISGKLNWAKVIGEPRMNYDQTGREWAFELEPDEAGIAILAKHGLTDRIKGKGYNIGGKGQFADRVPFIALKKPEFTKDGQPNKPIRLYDAEDKEWDQNKLIGNLSSADVKLDIRNYGPGKKSGIYPAAIRVTNLVPYENVGEFGAMGGLDKDEPAKVKAEAKKETVGQILDELNDEVLV